VPGKSFFVPFIQVKADDEKNKEMNWCVCFQLALTYDFIEE
jgi:hypothetical protein